MHSAYDTYLLLSIPYGTVALFDVMVRTVGTVVSDHVIGPRNVLVIDVNNFHRCYHVSFFLLFENTITVNISTPDAHLHRP